MRIFHRLAALGRALFRSGRIDAALAEEMRHHIEREADANMARGMSRDVALREARLSFGSIDAAQEASRDERPGSLVRQAARDARFGLRLLRKTPVFAATTILIVALGIGAATAVFTVVYGVMLQPLAFRDPGQLVAVWLTRYGKRNYPAAADAIELRRLGAVFTDVAFFEDANLNLVGDGEPQRVAAVSASANLFAMLGTSAAMGRTFTPGEDEAGSPRVVVLGDAIWRGRFGADSAVIGRNVRINDSLYTIVGVMPPDFQYPSGAQAWVPLVLDPGELTRAVTDNYRVVARLASNMTLDQAQRHVSALAGRLAVEYRGNKHADMLVAPMLSDAVRDVRPALLLLLGAVCLLLAIACVNLSTLFAARASARRAEFAVRLALGASRGRLIVQAIAESSPVLLAGGALGVALAAWSVRALVRSAPAGLPRVANVGLSATVIAFSFALLLITGIVSSVAPAVRAWSSDFTKVTRDGGRGSTAGPARALARRLAVAAQIALALPLLAGASLLVRSAINVMHVDLGFNASGVTTFQLEVSRSRHPSDLEAADYYARIVEAVRAVPGVQNAALVNRIPLSGGQTNSVHIDGSPDELTNVDSRTVTPAYFETLGIGRVVGRGFTERDDAHAPPVAVVDERLARTVWPGESAIGKRLRLPGWRNTEWIAVIGVVKHVRTTGVEVDPLSQVYWSYRQWTQDRAVLAVRSAAAPNRLIPAVTRAVHSVDAEQSMYDIRTMRDVVERSLAQRRLTTLLMAGFSGLAVLLAAVGLYGVVSYGVTQRLREFGIRVALGATPRGVGQLVVWQGASMAIVGAGVGLLLAVAVAGAMRNLVYGVAPRDVVSLGGATAFLIWLAVLASYIPARRAATVDPGMTLRAE